MQPAEANIGTEPGLAVRVSENGIREMQDVLSRYFLLFTEGISLLGQCR